MGGEGQGSRCYLRNRGDLGGIVKNEEKKGFRLVAADPDDVENSKESGREAKSAQVVCPFCRV